MGSSSSKSIVLSPRARDYIKQAAELEDQYISPEQKEKLWDKIADEFLMAGVDKHQISIEVRNSIQKQMMENYKAQKLEIPDNEAKINSGHYYRWARERGFTNPFFSRNTEESVASGNNEDTSDLTREVGDKEAFPILRNQMIFVFKEMIKGIRENIDLIKDEDHEIPFEIWKKFFGDERNDTKKFLDEMQSILVAHFEDANRCRDSRQHILPTERFLITAINYFVYDSWYCKRYHAIVKERSIITPKKLSIFREDLMSFSNLIFHTQIDPLNLHFLDIKCPGCGRKNLKTVWNKNGTWHITCNNEAAHNLQKPIFSYTMIETRLQELASNYCGVANNFVKSKSIEISENEPMKNL